MMTLNMLLMAAALTSPAEAARRSFLPTAPPVNVRTGDTEPYWGVGYLKFSVTLPTVIHPEFTLGGDEEAAYDIGDADYSADGMALAFGRPGEDRSRELALVGGRLDATLDSGSFEYSGVWFDSEHAREGGFAGIRTGSARRLYSGERLVLDWGLNSLLGVYWLRGNTDVESTSTPPQLYGYITTYQEKLRGLAWRPVGTLQPAVQLTRRITVIPFLGASAFLSVDRSSVYVLEWEDASYGPGCSDGCPEKYRTANVIPLEPFVGFDVDLQITDNDRLSLSSLFKATDPTNTERISEVYALYSRTPRR